MDNAVGRIGQWALLGGALVCLLIAVWLGESRPTITYTQPDEQQVVVSCAPTGWGLSEHHSVPGTGGAYYRVVEGQDVMDELRDAKGVNHEALNTNCLYVGDQRLNHIIWTTAGGLLLAGASGYAGLRRRVGAIGR